ncbi:nucleotide-sugar transporter [Vairimorpha apis BRL 01]|uniref:Nucleotide-sugar transporter n=1 Tax=Vairimorpha apis BRL 01 TaxID=1037528 RepID=T0LD80_9MICR|nr:nucleotide-sugar transporter [Vairimorpha apis BRL 01]
MLGFLFSYKFWLVLISTIIVSSAYILKNYYILNFEVLKTKAIITIISYKIEFVRTSYNNVASQYLQKNSNDSDDFFKYLENCMGTKPSSYDYELVRKELEKLGIHDVLKRFPKKILDDIIENEFHLIFFKHLLIDIIYLLKLLGDNTFEDEKLEIYNSKINSESKYYKDIFKSTYEFMKMIDSNSILLLNEAVDVSGIYIESKYIIVVAVIEYLFYKKKIFLIEFLSFICITVSSIDGNFYSHYIGYFWIFCNIISTTIYIISLKHTLNFNKGTVAESIFFPNCVAILVSFFMYVIFEHKKFSYFTIHIYMLIVVSSLSALLTSFSSALLLNNLSSTSFSMMGALNKIFMGFSGFIFLNENLNICKIFSINIGSLGLILYTYNLVKINK